MDHEQQQGGRPQDIRSDEDADGQWMTAHELSQLRGISKASAARLVRRRKWRRRTDNLTGIVRVLVPHDFLARTDSPADDRPGRPADMSRIISGFETALTIMREQLERERTRAEAAERRVEAERVRADSERARADVAEAARTAAEAATTALRQVEDARRRLSRWQRVRRAWRGE